MEMTRRQRTLQTLRFGQPDRVPFEPGGYIPGCDHGVPADVSWPDCLEYCRRLAEMTGWK